MEELWKDMSLSSSPVALSPAAAPHRGAVYPVDYLAGAVPQSSGTPPPHTATGSGDDPAGCQFGFSAPGGGTKRSVVEAPAAVGGDRRQRRMVKNRESATRSRARKQAYTNELEMELAQLRRENKMLIQREEDLINDRLAEAAQQVAVPECSSSSGRSGRSALQQKQQQQRRCRSSPAP